MSAPATTVLERILAETRAELDRRKREVPLESLRAKSAARGVGEGRPFHTALNRPGIGVIAEFKRRSPSAGSLRENADLSEIVSAYERGGAVAVSILTEGPNFAGALGDLTRARSTCALALLRKDFILDPYQLYEAHAAGADAVLLIVTALDATSLASLHTLAGTIGLDVLVEVHDRRELDSALELGADIVGVNNRDLRDFSVDVHRTEQLMDAVPTGTTVVSESGIGEPEQLRRLRDRGVQAVLVGESLMRASDPAEALRNLRSFTCDSEEL
jgi:indole-3-glycerol phosphate synthase